MMKYKNELNGLLPDTVVITSVEVLKSAFRQWVAEQMEERTAKEKEVMLDEASVLKRLGKSRATLWRWNTSGYLPCCKVGGKNCYRQSDIERIEKGMNTQCPHTCKIADDKRIETVNSVYSEFDGPPIQICFSPKVT